MCWLFGSLSVHLVWKIGVWELASSSGCLPCLCPCLCYQDLHICSTCSESQSYITGPWYLSLLLHLLFVVYYISLPSLHHNGTRASLFFTPPYYFDSLWTLLTLTRTISCSHLFDSPSYWCPYQISDPAFSGKQKTNRPLILPLPSLRTDCISLLSIWQFLCVLMAHSTFRCHGGENWTEYIMTRSISIWRCALLKCDTEMCWCGFLSQYCYSHNT